MSSASELRKRAEQFRRLWRHIADAAALRAISDVADELEMTADEIERLHCIRERAHAIWVEHGRPEGRDVDFWVIAEREVDIQRHGLPQIAITG